MLGLSQNNSSKKEESSYSSAATAVFMEDRRSRLHKARKIVSLSLVIIASAIWFESLGKLAISNEGLPWYISISLTALLSARLLKISSLPKLFLPGKLQSREPISFSESFAFTYLSTALLIYATACFMVANPSQPPKRIPHIVDIQLVSEFDAQNKNELLPGTVEHTELKKRQSDPVTVKGALLSKITKQSTVQPTKSSRDSLAQTKELEEKPQETPTPNSLMLPNSWSTQVFKPNNKIVSKPQSSDSRRTYNNAQPYISEVPPPELVELIENDGNNDALHVFQQGGKSSGGKGAENDLSLYLKNLHRQIKNNWSPPQGENKRVEILFRLKRDGHLAFLKVTRSAGEGITDTSAIKAVSLATANAKPLPKDYSHEYLDVAYTFKYNVDELKEVEPQ